MDLFNPFLVKTYQDILEKDPTSKVFCPLAQIYRLKKDLKTARQVCLQGIKYNPSYSAGYITLAQICGEEDQIEKALTALNKARELNPDNPKVYQIFGELYQKKKNIEKTLWAFKMVLFLRPWDQTARKIVQQLEKTLFKKTSLSPPPQEENRSHILRRKKMEKLQKFLTRIENHLAMVEN